MPLRASDPLLRRIERRSLIVCLVAAVAAVALRPRQPGIALGVVGGGLLGAVSYWAIRSGVDGLVGALVGRTAHDAGAARIANESGVRRRVRVAAFVLRFAGRYALLALLAYAMIARLRLHPVGVLIGASSIVVAVSLEAITDLSARRGGGSRPPSARLRNPPEN